MLTLNDEEEMLTYLRQVRLEVALHRHRLISTNPAHSRSYLLGSGRPLKQALLHPGLHQVNISAYEFISVSLSNCVIIDSVIGADSEIPYANIPLIQSLASTSTRLPRK